MCLDFKAFTVASRATVCVCVHGARSTPVDAFINKSSFLIACELL